MQKLFLFIFVFPALGALQRLGFSSDELGKLKAFPLTLKGEGEVVPPKFVTTGVREKAYNATSEVNMKMRSFTLSLLVVTVFSINLTSCGAAPASPTLTPLPTATATPTPTETPQPLLPQEVQSKFDQAGIDLKDMQNAKYDKDGLSITLESGEVILLTNEELEKNIYLGQDNVLQYRDETNQNVNYAYDKETGKWGVEVQYLSSTDGTVLWTKEGMADGELRVKDEKAKELRNDAIRALWAVNNALVNPAYIADTPQNIIDDRNAFLAQFPNANALIKYVDTGGEPIDIYIPVNSKSLSFRYSQSNMTQKVDNVDLSTIVVGFEVLPKNQLTSDYKSDLMIKRQVESAYVEFEGTDGQYLIETVTIKDSHILKWTFRREMSIDREKLNPYGRLAIYQEQTPEQKLIAISQLVKITLSVITDLKPEHTGINAAFDPVDVFMDYKKLFFSINNPDPVLGRNPKYRLDDYLRASDPKTSYFELSK